MRSAEVARQCSTGVSPVLWMGVLAVRFWVEPPSAIGFWFEFSFILIVCTGETPVLRYCPPSNPFLARAELELAIKLVGLLY